MPEKELAPHQQRVIDEYAELIVKVDALGKFIGGETYNKLYGDEQVRLEKQHRIMSEYSAILWERIENF